MPKSAKRGRQIRPPRRSNDQRQQKRGFDESTDADMYDFCESSEETPNTIGSFLGEDGFVSNRDMEVEDNAMELVECASNTTDPSLGAIESDEVMMRGDSATADVTRRRTSSTSVGKEGNLPCILGDEGSVVQSPSTVLEQSEQSKITTEPSPKEQAWKKLVRDTLNLLDGILSQQPITLNSTSHTRRH